MSPESTPTLRLWSVTVTGFGRTYHEKFEGVTAAEAIAKAMDAKGVSLRAEEVLDPDYPPKEPEVVDLSHLKELVAGLSWPGTTEKVQELMAASKKKSCKPSPPISRRPSGPIGTHPVAAPSVLPPRPNSRLISGFVTWPGVRGEHLSLWTLIGMR